MLVEQSRRGGSALPPPTARQRSRLARYDVAFSVVGVVLGVRSGLRRPRRLTVLAIASEAPLAVF